MSIEEWALLLSVIALGISIMTLPTVFQMFGGRPSLETTLDEQQDGNSKVLRVKVANRQVKNRFLRLMGVVRESADIVGQLTVAEAGSGKIILESARMWLTTDTDRGKQVILTPLIPARVLIALCRGNEVTLIVGEQSPNLDDPNNIKLDRGSYRVTGSIRYSHRIFRFTADFLVGVTASEFYWSAARPKVLGKGANAQAAFF